MSPGDTTPQGKISVAMTRENWERLNGLLQYLEDDLYERARKDALSDEDSGRLYEDSGFCHGVVGVIISTMDRTP